MSFRGSQDGKDYPKKAKPHSRRIFEKEIEELTAKYKEIEEELKSLNFKVPDKEFYSAQRNEDLVDLNLAKTRRENQFKEKRVVDADLRNVNQEIQTKFDAINKLKSSLKYKNPERVDQVIRNIEKQLQRTQLKPLEERRFLQEISELKASKAKIQDFRNLEEEVKVLKEKQKDLRDRRDENVKQITTLKQEETAARKRMEEHKRIEDEDWTNYKGNLSERDRLRNLREECIKKKKGLAEKFKKEHAASREHVTKKYGLIGVTGLLVEELEGRMRDMHTGPNRTITERRKPLEKEINLCDVLLSYLEKHSAQQTSPGPDTKEADSSSEPQASQNTLGDEQHLNVAEDLYRSVRRRPSKRERRRKQHSSETAKKLDHHVTVLERFVSLSVHAPATIAEVPNAQREIREKKKYLKEQQKLLQLQAEMKRAKSSPFIRTLKSRFDDQHPSEAKYANIYNKTQINAIQDTMKVKRKNIELFLHKRHKSCPSLLSENLEKDYNDFDSPCSSISRDISAANSEWDLESLRVSASNSEYDLDSPRSVTSSTTSFGDLKRESIDEHRKSFIIDSDTDYVDSKVMEVSVKHGKAQHKVHFASEVTVGEIVADKFKVENFEASKEDMLEVGESKVANEVMQNKPNDPSVIRNSDHTEAEEADILKLQKKDIIEPQLDIVGKQKQHLGNKADNVYMQILKIEEKVALSSQLGETFMSKIIQKSDNKEEVIDGHGETGEIYQNGPAVVLNGSDSENDVQNKFYPANQLQFEIDDLLGKEIENMGNGSQDGGNEYKRISSNESWNDSGNDNDNDYKNESDDDLQFEIELSGSHQDARLNQDGGPLGTGGNTEDSLNLYGHRVTEALSHQDARLNQDGEPLGTGGNTEDSVNSYGYRVTEALSHQDARLNQDGGPLGTDGNTEDSVNLYGHRVTEALPHQDARLNQDGGPLATDGNTEDSVNLYGHRVTEALSITPRSSTGCSPRRSTQDYLDQNSDDSVQVKT